MATWRFHICVGHIAMQTTTAGDVVVQGRKKRELPSFFIVFFVIVIG
jgi:hypothetical protein